MRYYNFAFPLFLMVAGAATRGGHRVRRSIPRVSIGLGVAAASAYAAYSGLSPFTPNFIDSPELRGFSYNRSFCLAFTSVSLLALLVWSVSPRVGSRIYLLLFVPIVAVASTTFIAMDLSARRAPDLFDRAGIYANRSLSPDQRSKLVVVGTNAGGLYKTLFHVDHPDAEMHVIDAGESVNESDFSADRRWALTIGANATLRSDYGPARPLGFFLAELKVKPDRADRSDPRPVP